MQKKPKMKPPALGLEIKPKLPRPIIGDIGGATNAPSDQKRKADEEFKEHLKRQKELKEFGDFKDDLFQVFIKYILK